MLAITFLVISLTVYTSASVSCIGENGRPVDWFVILKTPKLIGSSDPEAAAGYGYMYADATSNTLTWSSSSLRQNTTGALALTLTQIYKASKSSSLAWMFFNDELDTNFGSFGHTKGVVASDAAQGFYLVHSTPRFPPATTVTSEYYFPSDETDMAQHYLCMTYSASSIDSIGALFLLNKPKVFDGQLPTGLASKFPNLASVFNGAWNKNPTSSYEKLTTVGGTSFIGFGKSSEWNGDLYEGAISPYFNSGLYVQTWRNANQPDLQPTYCAGKQYKFDSINILGGKAYDTKISQTVTWSYTKDHSKWAITEPGSPNAGYTCLGDINRMFSQAQRGGGSYCFKNSGIYASFQALMSSKDNC